MPGLSGSRIGLVGLVYNPQLLYLTVNIMPGLSGSRVGRRRLGVGVTEISVVVRLERLEQRVDRVVVATARQIQPA